MSSPAINPTPPTPQQGPGGASVGGDMAAFARVSMAAQQVVEQFPESAQDMRQVQNLVRQATMKAIQQRSAPPQQAPQI